MTTSVTTGRPAGNRPVALVTGAGRGIGRGIALALAAEGCDIAGNDIVYESQNPRTGLFQVRDEVRALGARFLPLRGDVSLLRSHAGLLDRTLRTFGRLDVFVSNAGVAPLRRTDVLETSPESYDRVLDVNARGAFFLAQAAARRMIEARRRDASPCMVFVTSVSAEVVSTDRAEYCISKAALAMTARVFAQALAPHGIAVYDVRPGIIATDMTAPVKAKYDRLIADGCVPQGRWGTPEDVGRAVAALVRGDFGYSTGSVFRVGGGMEIRRL